MRIEKAVDQFLLDCLAGGLSRKTVRSYRYNVSRLQEYLEQEGVQEIAEVQPTHLRSFLAALQEKPLSPWTVDQFYRSMNVFLRWCIAQGYLDLNPLEKVRRPRLPKPRVPRLTLEQVERLLEAAQQTRFPQRDVLMVLLMVDSGLRVSEVIGLNKTDVDGNFVRVVGKGTKERLVPIGQRTRDAIDEYLATRNDGGKCDALLLSQNGQRLTISGVEIAIRKLGRKIGIEGLHPHMLRHTFANLFLCRNGDIRTLQLILGHADTRTTAMIYTEPSPKDLLEKHRVCSPVSQLQEEGTSKRPTGKEPVF